MTEEQEIALRRARFKAQQHLVTQALQFAYTRHPDDLEDLLQAHRTAEALDRAAYLAMDVPAE